jgi:hypothetical protein
MVLCGFASKKCGVLGVKSKRLTLCRPSSARQSHRNSSVFGESSGPPLHIQPARSSPIWRSDLVPVSQILHIANASSAADLAGAFAPPNENGFPLKQNTAPPPQTVAPIHRAVGQSERNHAGHEKLPGVRCHARTDDRWHFQILRAAVVPCLPGSDSTRQCQMFSFDPLTPLSSDPFRPLSRCFGFYSRST